MANCTKIGFAAQGFERLVLLNENTAQQSPAARDLRRAPEPRQRAAGAGYAGAGWKLVRQNGVVASRESAGMVPNPAHQYRGKLRQGKTQAVGRQKDFVPY